MVVEVDDVCLGLSDEWLTKDVGVKLVFGMVLRDDGKVWEGWWGRGSQGRVRLKGFRGRR